MHHKSLNNDSPIRMLMADDEFFRLYPDLGHQTSDVWGANESMLEERNRKARQVEQKKRAEHKDHLMYNCATPPLPPPRELVCAKLYFRGTSNVSIKSLWFCSPALIPLKGISESFICRSRLSKRVQPSRQYKSEIVSDCEQACC